MVDKRKVPIKIFAQNRYLNNHCYDYRVKTSCSFILPEVLSYVELKTILYQNRGVKEIALLRIWPVSSD